MIIFTSSKGQNFSPIKPVLQPTEPEFQQKAMELSTLLARLDLASLQSLMGISDSLAKRTQAQILGFAEAECKPALFTYSGEAFRSLDAAGLTSEDLRYAQDHLRILSGLYGVLRPLDLIAPHRLEMGYRLINPAGDTLYPLWRKGITAHLNKAMEKSNCQWLINLASMEYSKVVEKRKLCRPWLDIQFKEESGGTCKSVAIHAKRARGMMANFLIKNQCGTCADISCFSAGGYTFRSELSQRNLLVFTRPLP